MSAGEVEKKCVSCGKPADFEITPVFQPLTARGEILFEKAKKVGIDNYCACADCLMRVGAGIESGESVKEEDPDANNPSKQT